MGVSTFTHRQKWILHTQNRQGDVVGLLGKQRNVLGAPTTLSDPFLFPENEKAVLRIEQFHRKETIGIFGDYDADGITAAAQLVRFFRRKNS